MMNEYVPNTALIKKIIKETPDANTYHIKLIDKKSQKNMLITPGQFMMLGLFGVGESAISFSDMPLNNELYFTVRGVGNVTRKFLTLKEGDNIGIRGPYGEGWPLDKAKGKNILIVAGGMGLAPLKGVITFVKNNRSKFGYLEILYGAKTPNDMIFKYEFDKWRKIKNTRFDLTVDSLPSDASFECKIGLVTSCFPSMKTHHRNAVVFLCGPEIMMRYAAKCLETIGFKDNQIFISLERRMRCGAGKCGHCQVGTKYVCKDGPVFNFAEIKRYIHPL